MSAGHDYTGARYDNFALRPDYTHQGLALKFARLVTLHEELRQENLSTTSKSYLIRLTRRARAIIRTSSILFQLNPLYLPHVPVRICETVMVRSRK